MEAFGVTIDAINLLVKVVEFYHGYEEIPNDIKTELDRSKRSSQSLKPWVHIFQHLKESSDQNPKLEELCAPLSATLERLKSALNEHRTEMVKWMVKMGFREPMFEDELATPLHLSSDSRLSSDSLPSTDLRLSSDGSRPSSLRALHVQTSSSKITIAARKAFFVLMGLDTLKRLEKTIRDSRSEVMELLLTIATSTSLQLLQPNSESNASAELAVLNFVASAQRRQQENASVNIITEEEWINSYTKFKSVVDENVPNARQIHLYDITPETDSTKLKHRGLYICYSRSGALDEVESMKLARLFAVDEESNSSSNQFDAFRGDGDMLRCSAVVKPAKNLYLQYIFKVPPGSSTIRTLRTLLLDKRGCPEGQTVPLHPIADRVKFSIRLATSVLVVHSLGLVHKRIHPESILVIDADGSAEFPKTLGYPYLVGFHLSRSESARTTFFQDVQELAKRGIYFHPREQAETRSAPYFMISDIYSLGVCLLEIALWRSLFVVRDGQKDYVQDNSSGFEKLVDSYYGKEIQKANAKKEELIRIAEAEVPRTMGNTFAEVVVACLRAGEADSPFADRVELKSGRDLSYKNVSVKYLKLVLRKLHAVHDGLSGSH